MDASELHRKLLYNGYSDISAYLNDSPVNRFIYKQLIEAKPKYEIDTPMLTLFNEVYYVCVKVQSDRTPGENVEKRYLNAEELMLGSRNAAVLVLSIVCAIIHRKYKESFNDECFLKMITPLIENDPIYTTHNQLVEYLFNERVYSPSEFKTIPCPVEELPGSDMYDECDLWRSITQDFSIPVIEWYLTVYPTRKEQTELLNCIIGALTLMEKDEKKAVFQRIREGINAGDYLPHGSYYDGQDEDEDYPSVEEMRAYQTAGEDNERDYAEQYRQERDSYKLRLEEQKKAYDMEMARLEATYQTNLAELKAQLDQIPETKPVKQETESTPEPSFTIVEMVAYIKERFSKSGADEICAMLYRLAAEHHFDGEIIKLIDGIVPAILHRDMHYQYFELPNVHQFNNNPQTVVNNPKE